MSEKILLIDGHSILNRAFYGLPDLTNSEGKHTGAVYGFLNIMFRILEEEKPDYLTVAFDLHEPTFRHKLYDAYKGTRKGMPPELVEQVPLTGCSVTNLDNIFSLWFKRKVLIKCSHTVGLGLSHTDLFRHISEKLSGKIAIFCLNILHNRNQGRRFTSIVLNNLVRLCVIRLI